MPKLLFTILTIMFAWSEVGFSQSATAAQSQLHTQLHKPDSILHHSGFNTDQVTIGIAFKKCTIKRYRRPH